MKLKFAHHAHFLSHFLNAASPAHLKYAPPPANPHDYWLSDVPRTFVAYTWKKCANGSFGRGFAHLSRFLSHLSIQQKSRGCGPALDGQDFVAVRRSTSLLAISMMVCRLSPACLPMASMFSSAATDSARLVSSLSPSLSFSWRRVISASIAVIMKEVVDSSSIFTDSIPSNTSWGIRTFLSCDLLVTLPEAICTSPRRMKLCVYKNIKYVYINYLSLYTLSIRLYTRLDFLRCRNSEARQCWNTNRASHHKTLYEVTNHG